MAQAVVDRQQAGSGVFAVLAAVSFCHLLNDLTVSLLPAIYPILKSAFDLSFGQIGLITLVLQGIASLLQPLVGLYTDRKPQPYSLTFGMGCTLIGICLLAYAPNYFVLLGGAALLGLGASIFHPEASRLARLASGGAHGMAQSLFQVGGSFGSSIGPLLAAFFILPRGQSSLAWFALVALVAMGILALLGNWYRNAGHAAPKARNRARTAVVPKSQVRRAIAVLIALIFSKYFYLSSITSYYIFYLMHRFALPTATAQIYLFVFLAAAAAGTFIGGPIGDRFGRKVVIWVSILGVLPFTLVLPYVGPDRDSRLDRGDRVDLVVGVLGDRRLCAGADARPCRHGVRPVLRRGVRHGRHRRRSSGRAGRFDQYRIRLSCLFVPAADRSAHSRAACAQTYPSRPIRVIVGFPAGGTPTLLARITGQWLQDRLGQPVVVEDRPGASSNIATEAVVRAPADGYTLLSAGSPNAINASLYGTCSISISRATSRQSRVSSGLPDVMVVNPEFPAKTVPEFIAYAKANPGKLAMASAGNGTSGHVAGELFKMQAGVDLLHVPYRGGPPAVTDLLGGRVQVLFDVLTNSLELVRSGKLRALAVTTTERCVALPDIPTVAEFVPGYEASYWSGLGAPTALAR